MSRYFFHLTDDDGVVLLKDDEGESFDLLVEAKQNAALVAFELQRQSTLGGACITVTDERGDVIFKTPIAGDE
jgi:hypothetical protein